jgi:predicted lipoprotein with Yx(FWY)xxD motif
MKGRLLLLALLATLGALAVGAVAVAGASSGSASAAKKSSGAATVTVRKTKLGSIIVDGSGRTMYLFEKDKGGKSACNGACATAWPPLMTSGKPKATGGAEAKLLGTTKRSNGTQVTYAGHPIYAFQGDSKPGQTNGQGSKAFGAEWYVLAPNGKKIDKS